VKRGGWCDELFESVVRGLVELRTHD
jgi:hypothetical protein